MSVIPADEIEIDVDNTDVVNAIEAIPETPATDVTPIVDAIEAIPETPATDLTPVVDAVDTLRLSSAITEADMVRLLGSVNTNTIATTTALNAKITGLQTALLARAESELGLAKQLIKVKQLSLARPQTTARMNFQEDLDDMLDGSFTLQTIDDLRTTLRTEIGTLSEDSPLWADYHALQVTLDILSLNLRAVANTQHTLTSIENELSPLQNLQSDISTILQDVLADIKARQTAIANNPIDGEQTFWPVVVTALGNLIASYSLSNLSEAIRRLKQARDSLRILANLADENKANALIYRLEQNYEAIREKNQSVVNKLADVQSAINNISVDVPAITLQDTNVVSVLKNAIDDIGDTASLQDLKTKLQNLYDGFDIPELDTAITALDAAFTGDDAITDTHAAYFELQQLRFILKSYKVEFTERNTNVVRKLTDLQAAINGLELTAGDITVTNTDLVNLLNHAIIDIGDTANLQSLKTTLTNLYNGFNAAELTAAINALNGVFSRNDITNTHAAYLELLQLRFILLTYKTNKDSTDAVKTATESVKTATDGVKNAVNAIPAPPSNADVVRKLSDVQSAITNLELTAGDIDVAAQPDIADLIQGAIVDIGSDTSGNLQDLKTKLTNLYDGFDVAELTAVITAMRTTFTGNGAISSSHSAYAELKKLQTILRAYNVQIAKLTEVKTAVDANKNSQVQKLTDVQTAINNLELTAGDINVDSQPDIADLIKGAIVDIGSSTTAGLQTTKTRLQNLYDGFAQAELNAVITNLNSLFTGQTTLPTTHAAYDELKKLLVILRAYNISIQEKNAAVVSSLNAVKNSIDTLDIDVTTTAGQTTLHQLLLEVIALLDNSTEITAMTGGSHVRTTRLATARTSLFGLFDGFDLTELETTRTNLRNGINAILTSYPKRQTFRTVFFVLNELSLTLAEKNDAVTTKLGTVETNINSHLDQIRDKPNPALVDKLDDAIELAALNPSRYTILSNLQGLKNGFNELELTNVRNALRTWAGLNPNDVAINQLRALLFDLDTLAQINKLTGDKQITIFNGTSYIPAQTKTTTIDFEDYYGMYITHKPITIESDTWALFNFFLDFYDGVNWINIRKDQELTFRHGAIAYKTIAGYWQQQDSSTDAWIGLVTRDDFPFLTGNKYRFRVTVGYFQRETGNRRDDNLNRFSITLNFVH